MSARVRGLNTNTDSVGFIDPVKATKPVSTSAYYRSQLYLTTACDYEMHFIVKNKE